MGERRLRILQVSTADIGGGAEKVAWNLFEAYRRREHDSWLAVGNKRTQDSRTLGILNHRHRSGWARSWAGVSRILFPPIAGVRGISRMRSMFAQAIGQPQRMRHIWQGREDFEFPGTWHLLDLPPHRPDILHCHNLHGGYFDLSALAWLSHQVPVMLTLHDAWLLSGHCAHSFDCERWKVGCGDCPDLTIYPSIPRDATSFNWLRKRSIYKKSRLYVVTPCRWLMQKVDESSLADGVVGARVIPNGVDLSIFCPGNKRMAREELGIPSDAKVILVPAKGLRKNIWKDHETLRAAMVSVSARLDGQKLLFVAVGESMTMRPPESVTVRFIPKQDESTLVAKYCQAADIYVHPARADTFPNSVIEALACGVPVVATDIGGIPEQVTSFDPASLDNTSFTDTSKHATGILVPIGDVESMSNAIEILMQHEALRTQLGENAARDARNRFDLVQQVSAYLQWYSEILQQRHHMQHPDSLSDRENVAIG